MNGSTLKLPPPFAESGHAAVAERLPAGHGMRDVHGDAVAHLHGDDVLAGVGVVLRQAEAAPARHRGQDRRRQRQQDLHQPARDEATFQHGGVLHRAVGGRSQEVHTCHYSNFVRRRNTILQMEMMFAIASGPGSTARRATRASRTRRRSRSASAKTVSWPILPYLSKSKNFYLTCKYSSPRVASLSLRSGVKKLAEICSDRRHDPAHRPQEQPHCAASSFRGEATAEAAVQQKAGVRERGWVTWGSCPSSYLPNRETN